jgi:CHAT domain-containing protein/Tfp pilus assembly protein PilF
MNALLVAVLCAAAPPADVAAPHEAEWTVLDDAERLRNAGKADDAAARIESLAAGCRGDATCAAIALLGRAEQVYFARKSDSKTLFEEARVAFEKLGYVKGAGRAWLGLAWVNRTTEPRTALEQLGEALELARTAEDKKGEARTIHNFGYAWSDLGEKRKALEYYEQALSIRRAIGDRAGEATTLNNMGLVWSDLGDKRKALEFYDQALLIRRAIGDRAGESATLHNLGLVWSDLGDKRKALEFYDQALPIRRAIGDRAGEAWTLNNLGAVWSDLGEKQKALEFYDQALPLRRAVGDRSGEALTLINIGNVWYSLREMPKALESYEQALLLRRAVGDRAGEAATLHSIGNVWFSLREMPKALGSYEQALPIYRALGDRAGEAATLQNLGRVWYSLREMRKALEFHEQALPTYRALGDRAGEAATLHNIGNVWYALDEERKALESYEQALSIRRALGDRWGEGATLTGIGAVWYALDEQRKALESYEQALSIRRSVGDRSGEAATLTGIGAVWRVLGEKRKALEFYEQALSIQRALGDRSGEAATLLSIGNVRSDLGEKRNALDFYERALPLKRDVGDRFAEAAILNGIGTVWSDLGDKRKALEFYEQALPIQRAIGDRWGEGATLHNIGVVWSGLGEKRKALEFYEQDLSMERAIGHRSGEAATLNNMGGLWYDLGDERKALELYEQALPIWRAVGDRSGEALTLSNLARLRDEVTPAQAILHAKQAVNLYQSLRADIRGVGKETERTYAESVSGAYRRLADLLVAEDRVLEAQQVMDLLKGDELNRLLRRSGPPGGSVRLSATERAADEKYRTLGDQLAETEGKLAGLRSKREPTPEMLAEIASLESTAARRREALGAYFAGLAAGLAKAEAERERSGKELETIQADLPEGTVAVYTVFGKERTRLLVYGRDSGVSREVALDSGEVSRRVFALRAALTDPAADPRAASAKVYEVLVAPIAADLAAANARTILWSLDGPLRYVPTAALWDATAKQWLVERFETVEITTASLYRLNQARSQTWKALGLGVTARHGDLEALTSVDGELRAVVRDERNARGALPGKRLLDASFTRKTFFEELSARWPVVHLASHYVFRVPENPEDEGSYLLLGDGDRLSLKDLSELKKPVFAGVDLLALSACETAVGSEVSELSGAEVDGLAMVAQQRGAAGVLATLWPVNDPATAAFMGDLYGRLRTKRVTKADALRQAQVAMLRGSAESPKPGSSRRGIRPGAKMDAESSPFPGWSHPYYWAPFILLGNGR